MIEIESRSEADTLALGKKLGERALPGQIYTLDGDLGVGKTMFTKGMAEGLGSRTRSAAPPLPSSRSMREDGCPFTISTYTGSEIRRKWRRSDMTITFSVRASA